MMVPSSPIRLGIRLASMSIPVRTAATPGQFEIATESGYVPVDIRRHPRARNYTLRVGGPGKPPVLTMPERGSVAEAHRFLERHAEFTREPGTDVPPALLSRKGDLMMLPHRDGTDGGFAARLRRR